MAGIEPQRTARLYYLRLLRLKGDPQSLARGMTVGVAIGIIPILPLQTLFILIFAPLFKGNSIAGVIAGFLVSNPLTLLPQYYICWRLGKLVYPADLSWSRVREIVEFVLSGSASFNERVLAISQLGYEYIAILLLGGFLLAIPLALITYPLSLRLFLSIQRRRRRKHILS